MDRISFSTESIRKYKDQIVSYMPPKENLLITSLCIGSFAYGGWSCTACVGAAYWLGKQICHKLVDIQKIKINNGPQLKKRGFLRRIPEEDWIQILQKIEQLNHKVLPDERKAFRLGEWNHPIFVNKDWAYFAFHEYLIGNLTVNEISKLLLYDACQRQAESDRINESDLRLQVYQLVDSGGNIDEKALSVLQESTETYLNHEHFNNLIEKLRKMPPEKTQFFSINRNRHDSLFSKITSTSNRVEKIAWKFLTRFYEKNIWQVVVPPELLYEILFSRFQANAMRLIPVIGYSKIEKFSDPNARIIFIPCSFVRCTTDEQLHFWRNYVPYAECEEVHSSRCSPLTVFHHDVYHHSIEAANMHRSVWIEFAQFIKNKGIEEVFPITFDREFIVYVKGKESDVGKFWMALCDHSTALSGEPANLNEGQFIELFTEFYFRNSYAIDVKFGLNLDNFKSFLESIAGQPNGYYFETFLTKLYDKLEATSNRLLA